MGETSRQSAVRYARIGGLAVATGLGAALATGHGIAAAEPSSSTNASHGAESKSAGPQRPAAKSKQANSDAPKSDSARATAASRPAVRTAATPAAAATVSAAAVRSAPNPLAVLNGGGAPAIPSPADVEAMLGGVRRDLEQLQSVLSQSVTNLFGDPAGSVTAGLAALRTAVANVDPKPSDTPSKGFQLYTIYNLSPTPITLVNVNIVTPEGAGKSVVRTPPVGTVVQPGDKITLELAQKRTSILGLFSTTAFRDTDVILSFKDGNGAIVNVRAEYTYWQARPVTGGGGLAICDTSRCKVEGDEEDARRTVFVLGAGDSALDATNLPVDRQQKIVGLCGASQVSCKWVDSKVVRGTYGQAEVIGSIVHNNTDKDTSSPVAITVSKAYSSSLKGGVKGGFDLLGVIKAEVSTEYTSTWTDTYSTTQTVPVPLPPHTAGWVEARVPVDVVTGTLVVQTPGQTIYLQNIRVEVPIAGGKSILAIENRALPRVTGV
ncbi:hypothetical protein ACTXG7_12510 [Mycolicibacterium sp. Dal123E01]|uniref:hypothetical protein n=1 Tax=Mycolicibacterium sp. Dal123E01 TaxID=3457578 RepID=UPI00403E7613